MVVVDEVGAGERSLVSWGAVIAGAIAACTLTLLLVALGVALGLTAVSPWSNEGVSATTFKVGAGVYMIVVAMIASAVGGMIAGRMRATWAGVDYNEVYFRDSAHGFLVWALATLLSASVLGGVTTHVVGSTASGLLSGAGAAASTAAGPADAYVDSILRSDNPSAAANADASSVRAEFGRALAPVFAGGEISADNRTYLGRVVAARAGISQADAEARVSQAVTSAKSVTDETRKATAKFAFWLVASMLAGALSASLAAIEGGVFRDSRWYEPGWKKSQRYQARA
jgi:hypothetical protein